ncbi:hypothetical protein Q4506_06325 [Colwellia sp. 4_MG-2023]|uniref:AbiU2 domain-containing protein n=1 Tax=unclassified Colwellia TaxID=196834 RepID=UPI0026E23F32|nr:MULTISPECIES: hypothetical protein [unclassified Colwellia]MDO6506463.1 hypothetical protein [Colwellia sp. 5_MG-2023]MDO6555287.1 hypothetical protein [Colwellia sp. 4_MG-2023]
MDELDRYLYELSRVQKNVNLYDELFCDDDARQSLRKMNSGVFNVFQRSLNTEIILSVASLFDSDGFTYKKEKIEYLSQKNLVQKYEHHLDEKLRDLREETTKHWKELNIKSYRDIWIAHNDHKHMMGQGDVKHNISTDILIALLSSSYQLIFGIRMKEFDLDYGQITYRLDHYTGANSGGNFLRQVEEFNKSKQRTR